MHSFQCAYKYITRLRLHTVYDMYVYKACYKYTHTVHTHTLVIALVGTRSPRPRTYACTCQSTVQSFRMRSHFQLGRASRSLYLSDLSFKSLQSSKTIRSNEKELLILNCLMTVLIINHYRKQRYTGNYVLIQIRSLQ